MCGWRGALATSKVLSWEAAPIRFRHVADALIYRRAAIGPERLAFIRIVFIGKNADGLSPR